MITKNQTKIQIVKELLDKKQITFEQCLILLEEPNEKVSKTENRLPSNNPYNSSSNIYSNTYNGYTSNSTDDSTIK
jgi:hypothetical protein